MQMPRPVWQPGHVGAYRYFTVRYSQFRIGVSAVLLPLMFRTTSIDRLQTSLDRDSGVCTLHMPATKGNRPCWSRLRAVLGRCLYLLKSMGSTNPCPSSPNLAVQVKTLAPRHTQNFHRQTLVSLKTLSLLYLLAIQKLHIFATLSKHLLHHHGPTIVSYGATTSLPDLHCSDLGHCHAYAV